jgi:predicted dehydrogenase
MESQLRVAVIGCGGIARGHLNAMKNLSTARPVAMVDLDETRARQYAEEYRADRYHTDIADALTDDVDAVIVCLPHYLHVGAAIAAAESGKHILTEKPMAISLKEADDMIEAAMRNNVRLMVGQVLRFRGCNVEAKRLIKDGKIGEPRNIIRRRLSRSREFRSEWARDPAKAGGWVLYGYGSHEVDMMLWLFDTHANRVYAQARKNNPYWNDYDEIGIQMELANGMIATLNHSLNCVMGAWDTFITGTKASMYITNQQITIDGEKIDVPMGPAMELQLKEFINAINEGREPESSGVNVRKTMQALEAARLSIAKGQIMDTKGM